MIFSINTAAYPDSPDLAHLHVEGWRAAYGGLADQDYLDALDHAEKEAAWRNILMKNESTTLIARVDGGNPAGFVSFGRLRTPPPGSSPIRPLYSAEIYALYVLPEYWRKGLGRQLLAQAAAGLKDMKHDSLCLWVLDGNKRAIEFYKAMGGQRIGKKQVEIGGRILAEAVFGWRDTEKLRKDMDKKS